MKCGCGRCGCKQDVSSDPSELARAYRTATENRRLVYGQHATADSCLVEHEDLCVDCRVGVHTCACECGCGVAGVSLDLPVWCVACTNGSHRKEMP